MLLTDDPDTEVGVVVGEVVPVAVIETVEVVTVAIEENQKQPRKSEVIKKMITINLKLMKSQGVLMAIAVEDEEGDVDVVLDGLSGVVNVVKVLATKNIHPRGNARTKKEIVPKVNEEQDVAVAATVDQDVIDEDQDVHHHRAQEMKEIETAIGAAIGVMKNALVNVATETERMTSV